jgi:hypothetical protein
MRRGATPAPPHGEELRSPPTAAEQIRGGRPRRHRAAASAKASAGARPFRRNLLHHHRRERQAAAAAEEEAPRQSHPRQSEKRSPRCCRRPAQHQRRTGQLIPPFAPTLRHRAMTSATAPATRRREVTEAGTRSAVAPPCPLRSSTRIPCCSRSTHPQEEAHSPLLGVPLGEWLSRGHHAHCAASRGPWQVKRAVNSRPLVAPGRRARFARRLPPPRRWRPRQVLLGQQRTARGGEPQ